MANLSVGRFFPADIDSPQMKLTGLAVGLAVLVLIPLAVPSILG